MRDIKNKLTIGKNTKDIQSRKGKSFGYQILGFGSAGGVCTDFICATGGNTIIECGSHKIHIFTSSGTFCVARALVPANNNVDYLIVAGGGGAGNHKAGGGGGGGFRASSGAASGCYTASPYGSGVSAAPVSVQGYPIVVGGGGTANGGGNLRKRRLRRRQFRGAVLRGSAVLRR